MDFKISTIIISIILMSLSIENEGYRLLGIFPLQAPSHQVMFDAIMKGVARKGHQIDVITMWPLENPPENYTVVVNLAGKQKSLANSWNIEFATEFGEDALPIIAETFGNALCEYLGLPEMQEIIKNPPNNPLYDLIIMEGFSANCFIGLGYALKVPVILASSTIPLPWLGEALGQPHYSAFVPSYFTNYRHPMSFTHRLLNTIKSLSNRRRYRFYTDEVQNARMKKYIDPNIPPLQELEKDVVLALVNSWPSLTGIKPQTPAIIEVGGIHVQENYVPLPPELEKWLNQSNSGLIYFTLGSIVNIETFPEVTMRAIYSVFRRISPVRVLMKVANQSALLPGLPNNVMTSPWIPQVAVLAHKNTKFFITHGGLMGTQEALTYGVPMIGIPLFSDQHANIVKYVNLGMALELDVKKLTEASIYSAIREILDDPKYSEAAKFQSRKFLDRPMSAMDTAIYWIEYAIRHGPGTLRSPIVDIPWWKVALLDVYAFLIVCSMIGIYLITLIAKAIMKVITSTETAKHEKSD